MTELAHLWDLVARVSDPSTSEAERDALAVLADAWLAADHPEGSLLACALAEPGLDLLSDDIAASEKPTIVEMKRVLADVAARDMDRATRWLSALDTSAIGEPLHAPVAAYLTDMLEKIERRELNVIDRLPSMTYLVENGWRLQVFVRGWNFWRIDYAYTPDGHMIQLISFNTGPLADVNEYEPPEDVESEVYGLGYTPTRRWPPLV